MDGDKSYHLWAPSLPFFLQLEDRNAISSLNLYGFCEHCESESLFIKLLQAEWDWLQVSPETEERWQRPVNAQLTRTESTTQEGEFADGAVLSSRSSWDNGAKAEPEEEEAVIRRRSWTQETELHQEQTHRSEYRINFLFKHHRWGSVYLPPANPFNRFCPVDIF